VSSSPSIGPDLERVQKTSFIIGLVALLACLIGAVAESRQFFEAYLMAYIFWLGIALGCLAILMIHHIAGGHWGFAVRRLMEAASRTLPLLAFLFIPVLFGLHSLYVWSRPDAVAADELLRHKEPYLNIPFFLVRAVMYFVIWSILSLRLEKASAAQDEAPSREATRRLALISGTGLVLYMLTMTFASIDWAMSLEPHWFSTVYGILMMSGQVLGGFAFLIVVASLLVQSKPYSELIQPQYFHDLGNFLLTFVIFWAYIAFSQFLIIWSGNLSDENPWYLHRFEGGWQWMGIALLVLHFFIPFLLLLSRDIKRRSSWLAAVAWGVFLMCFVDVVWIVAPGFGRAGFQVHWMDLVATIGIGGVWIAAFVGRLKAKSAVPVHDSRVEEELEWA